MIIKKILLAASLVVIVLTINNCSAVSETKKNELSNKFWTNTDSEILADSLIGELLMAKDIADFLVKYKPKILVGKVTNLTDEKINSTLIEKNIERSLLNSGKTAFISDKNKLEESRINRKNVSDFKSAKEFNKYLKLLKSDYFLTGELELNIDSLSTIARKEYKFGVQVLKIKNMETVFNKSVSIFK